jgi:hypothetical protein
MQIRTTSAFVMALILCTTSSLPGQSSTPPSWSLPQGTAVKDSGPRTYRFTVDYTTANTKGETVLRQHVTGEYTRGLAGGEVMWKNVTQADAPGAAGPFAAAQKRDFIEGFRYHNDLGSTMKPEFFK